MFTSLMSTRRFAPLFWTQAFSAFGDNFLKQALVFVLLYRLGEKEAGGLIQLAAAALTGHETMLIMLAGLLVLGGLEGRALEVGQFLTGLREG